MNKSWNDRADKDLFFTILNVKNIGIISGNEWSIIGNHMRGLGYGFTNEGCRQHFQGLRRAQNKSESGELGVENAKIDPTQDPITRRPGPGRGRPRKQPAPAAAPLVAPMVAPMATPHDAQDLSTQAAATELAIHELSTIPPSASPPEHPSVSLVDVDHSINTVETLSLDKDDDDDDTEEQASKRPKLEQQHQDVLEDEPVLALAVHNNSESYPSPDTFSYGEA